MAKPEHIMSVMDEKRVFHPSKKFVNQANLSEASEYLRLYKDSINNPEKFWSNQAKKEIIWFKKWKKVLSWRPPFAKWFIGGKLNVSYNCLDRHLNTPIANKAALIWEGEPFSSGENGESRTLTYAELHRQVCIFSNVLKRHKVKKGDRVIIYMPLVPEAVIAMLACARIGAIHSVVFGGFSAESLADRIQDCQAKMVVTADGGFRRGSIITLKNNLDHALKIKDSKGKKITNSVLSVIVLRRARNDIHMEEGRDFWWHQEMEYVDSVSKPEVMDSESPLFILYTSGSTGKPKGILHTTAGYLLGVRLSSRIIFDLKDTDVYWCTADIGWVTGHSYVVYGPLSNGATVVLYEGAPNFPEPDRFWRIIERYKVTIFYTAPTAIRSFMKWGSEWIKNKDLSSLRLLGTVGEPINPEAWIWYHKNIGKNKCPIVDTWWQTETGSIMISPIPGIISTKPGSATLPFWGVCPEILNENGKPVKDGEEGLLVISKPWPAMLRGFWKDPKRYKEVYWKNFKNKYFTGDGAKKDRDGYYWITGRVDDVLSVAGHRIGTAEVEGALVSHKIVAEAAVVGRPDDIKGHALVAFVIIRNGIDVTHRTREDLRLHVALKIGSIAKPDEIRFVEALPKTRSGKIMRRLLKQIAMGVNIEGDFTTLEDKTILLKL